MRERGRTGVAAIGRILYRRAELAGIPHSVLERRMLRLLEQHGVALPACQVPVRRPDGRMAYLDFAYRDLGLGIEVDGNIAHATPAQRSADNVRGNGVALRDIRLIRFTYEQVTARARDGGGNGAFASPIPACRLMPRRRCELIDLGDADRHPARSVAGRRS